MVRVEGKIAKQSIFILIDPGSTHSYVTLIIVKSYGLKRNKHAKSWLVQLATITKRKVSEVVEECPIEINGFLIIAYLNIFPLGSYNALIGIYWLENHRAKVDCYAKIVEYHNEEVKLIELKGVP